jgi:hypothetical protein
MRIPDIRLIDKEDIMDSPSHLRPANSLHRHPDPVNDGTFHLLKHEHAEKSETAAHARSSAAGRAGKSGLTLLNPATVLRELFELLEDYAPAWYTEENHTRALAALARGRR